MTAWKAFDLIWENVPEDTDYVQLRITGTDYPRRALEPLLNKLKKHPKPEEQPDAKQFVKQMAAKVGTFTESCFRQKPSKAYVAHKYFSWGLTCTEEKCHVLINMTEHSPMYVYQCEGKEQYRYVSRCNDYRVLVNESSIESHFVLHEIPMFTNYIAPVDTVYFFFTAGPSFFILESLVPPFDLHVSIYGSRKNSQHRESENSDKSKATEPKPSKRNKEQQQSQHPSFDSQAKKLQHQHSSRAGPSEILTDLGDVLTMLNQNKQYIMSTLVEQQYRLEQYAKAVNKNLSETEDKMEETIYEAIRAKDAEIDNLKRVMAVDNQYLEEKCAAKDTEIAVMRGRHAKEIHSLKVAHEVNIKTLSVKVDVESKKRLEIESQKKDLETTHKNMIEWNDEMTVTIDNLEKENKQLRQRLKRVFLNFHSSSVNPSDSD